MPTDSNRVAVAQPPGRLYRVGRDTSAGRSSKGRSRPEGPQPQHMYGPRFTPGSVSALAIFGEAGRPTPPRPADPVPDWKTKLRSPKRSRVTSRKVIYAEIP